MRPALLRGRNEDWLFPGSEAAPKRKISFSGQITKRVQKATGLRITVHQFRHAAGAIILKHRPGDYQLVRLLLGHRSIETTLKSYVGFESIHASEVFGQIIARQAAIGSGGADMSDLPTLTADRGMATGGPRSLGARPVGPARASRLVVRQAASAMSAAPTTRIATAHSLASLQRTGRLESGGRRGRQINPENVEAYLADLERRVSDRHRLQRDLEAEAGRQDHCTFHRVRSGSMRSRRICAWSRHRDRSSTDW